MIRWIYVFQHYVGGNAALMAQKIASSFPTAVVSYSFALFRLAPYRPGSSLGSIGAKYWFGANPVLHRLFIIAIFLKPVHGVVSRY